MSERWILCLHGSSQDAEVFRSRLDRLSKRCDNLGIRLAFIDAPFELPLRKGQEVPMRCWFPESSDAAPFAASVDTALTVVEQVWKAHSPPFSGLLGFSQGAAVIYELLKAPQRVPGCSVALLAGAAADSRSSLVDVAMDIPTLHAMGAKDTLVPLPLSMELAKRFKSQAEILEHDQGHCVPGRAAELDRCASFLAQHCSHPPNDRGPMAADIEEPPDAEHTEAQADELESLESIYMDNLQLISPQPRRLAITVPLPQVPGCGVDGGFTVEFTMPRMYPDVPVGITLHGKMVLREPHRSTLRAHLEAHAKDNVGDPHVFSVISEAQEWLEDNFAAAVQAAGAASEAVLETTSAAETHTESASISASGDEEAAVARLIEAASKSARHTFSSCPSSGARGQWKYVVGLVGKPSAGKSTLFNAVTKPASEVHAAKVAAHPFTTILPNVGTGWCCVEDSSGVLGVEAPGRHGRTRLGRRIPVTVKDVAGLVPGACVGRGKGNQFLDDLVDADVLVHVVDVSGTTDAEGVAQGDICGDPVKDVGWVHQEIHRWIFDNVKRKWLAIQHRPFKLLEMFSGYRATKGLIREVYIRVSGDAACEMKEVPGWTDEQLHAMVAGFLRARFPILIAANKADLPSAADNLKRLKAECQHETVVAVSAQSECILQALHKDGAIRYSDGDESFEVLTDACDARGKPLPGRDRLDWIRTSVLGRYGSTGCLEAVSAAVQLRAPVLAFPVGDLETLAPMIKQPRSDEGAASTAVDADSAGDDRLATSEPAGAARGRGPLLDCLLMRPGSLIEDLYNSLKHMHYVDGDYVRAEALVESKGVEDVGFKKRVVRKDEALLGLLAVRIMTNRKVRWQEIRRGQE